MPHTLGHGEAYGTYPNGDTYEGEYSHGKRAGKGKLWQNTEGPGGQGTFEGVWKDDRPWEGFSEGLIAPSGRCSTTSSPRCSHPTLLCCCARYTGTIKRGLRDGGGSLFHRDGSVFVGEFRRGEKFQGRVLHEPPLTEGAPGFVDLTALSTVSDMPSFTKGLYETFDAA